MRYMVWRGQWEWAEERDNKKENNNIKGKNPMKAKSINFPEQKRW